MRGQHREGGYALASTVLLSGVVLIMAAFIVSRVVEMAQNLAGDREWENALQVADSGIDYAVSLFAADPDYTTGHGEMADKDAVIAAALAVDAADVIATPGGEFVVIAPTSGDVVYSVGFAPSRDAAQRTRVVRSTLDGGYWEFSVDHSYAFLAGNDMKVEAKKSNKDVEIYGDRDWVHSNGTMYFKSSKAINNVHLGCLTGYENQYSNDGNVPANVDCPAEGTVPFVDIPDVDPLQIHYLSQYDICPDGTIRHGPASPDVGALPGIAGEPCSGGLVFGFKGVKNAQKGNDKVEFKGDESDEGVYFLWGRSAKIKTGKDDTFHITVIAAKPDGDLTCQKEPGGVKIDKDRYGDVEVEVEDESYLLPHPDGGPYAVVTSGDIILKVKGKASDDPDKDKRGTAFGLFLAREQIKLESNDADAGINETPKGAVRGALVAQGVCDTKSSKVKDESVLKKGDIVWSPDYAGVTDFFIQDGSAVAYQRREL